MKVFILPILISIIAGLGLFYFTRDKVDVRYILSENIPLSYYNDIKPTGNIQQLEIKNTGDVLVKKIIIKINKQIDDYSIKKYAEVDSVNISKKAGFEINYPELPPKGSIKIILKTKESIISDDDIEINDDKGIITEALAKDQNIDYLRLFTIISSLIITFYYGYLMFMDNIKFNVENQPLEKILKRGKRFLLSDSKWEVFRKEAIENLFKKDIVYFSSIENTLCYEILCDKKPMKVNESEWQKILIKAQEKYGNLIKQECLSSPFRFNDKILNLKRPPNFDEKEWEKVVDTVGRFYSLWKKNDLKYGRLPSFREFLMSEKPFILTDSIWKSIKEEIEEIYFYKLVNNIIGHDFFNAKTDLEIQLNDREKEKKLKELNENVIKYKQCEIFYSQLKNIVSGIMLSKDKPEELDIIEWDELKVVNYKIEQLKLKAEEQLKEMVDFKKEFGPQKEKIIKQLEIIDKVLIDPDFVNKIESYNNAFSSGNFENLKRLAFLNRLENKRS